MKTAVNLYDFERAFVDRGREDQFTYEGKKALFEYLENYEEDTGEEIEFDVIALCCEYTEYKNIEEFRADYSSEEYHNIEDIENKTQVIKVGEEGFIIQQF